ALYVGQARGITAVPAEEEHPGRIVDVHDLFLGAPPGARTLLEDTHAVFVAMVQVQESRLLKPCHQGNQGRSAGQLRLDRLRVDDLGVLDLLGVKPVGAVCAASVVLVVALVLGIGQSGAAAGRGGRLGAAGDSADNPESYQEGEEQEGRRYGEFQC